MPVKASVYKDCDTVMSNYYKKNFCRLSKTCFLFIN